AHLSDELLEERLVAARIDPEHHPAMLLVLRQLEQEPRARSGREHQTPAHAGSPGPGQMMYSMSSDGSSVRERSATGASGTRTRAGTPTATALAGTSLTTTALAPICASSPTHTGPSTLAPAPTVTRSPRVGCRLPRLRDRPPSVTPWYSMTSSPTTVVSPITTPMPWSMNSRRPIRAPGWISMPVVARA